MKRAAILAAVVLALCAASFLGGLTIARKRPVQPPIIQIDTIYHRDTITAYTPVYVRERVTDTMLVAVTDTLRLHDTTFVQLPRTEREYADSTYRAVVSGYDPKLERIEVYRQTLEVTKTVTLQDPRRWSLGIQAGVGVGIQGLTPYLGVGVSYDLLRF